MPGYDSICLQLENYGVAQEKIKKYSSDVNNNRELSFFQYARELRDTSGACAEVGVFQGDTARIINQAFADRKLYLFDTFSGFDERDVGDGKESGIFRGRKQGLSGYIRRACIRKKKYPNQCIIKKGYFPETAEGIEETFAFVRLDVDMYKPTKAGLEWFGKRMEKGGILISHDYYTESYSGVAQAIR